MRKNLIIPLLATALSASASEQILSSTGVVENVSGMGGEIKINVIVQDSIIKRVKVTQHYETPEYYEDVVTSGLLNRWDGLTLREATTVKIDAVSGATVTSEAIIESVYQIAKDAIK